MPYPHHPQHQHHQKGHSPSQLGRGGSGNVIGGCLTPPNLDASGSISASSGSSSSSSIINCPHDLTQATNSAEAGHVCISRLEQHVATRPSLSDSQNALSSSSSSSVSFSSSSSASVMTSSLDRSSSPPVSNSTSQSHHLPLQGIALAISEPPTPLPPQNNEESQILSSCQQPTQEDVNMMPLDLSFRAPRTESSHLQTPDLQSGGSLSKPSIISTPGYSRSHRMSPYPLFTLGLPRSPGTTSIPLSRSPHSRSNSPFYHHQRQTPSPYFPCLSQPGSSYYNAADNSSFQVLSATNRVLNGLAVGSSSVFRPYEDHPPSEATPPPPQRMPMDEEVQNQEQDESEEPTYYDLDSTAGAQKQATTATLESDANNFNHDIGRSPSSSSSLYGTQFHGVSSLNGVNSLNVSQYNGSNASPYISPASGQHEGAATAFTTFSTPSTSTSSSSPTSSTPPALLSSFISQEVSEQAHCDLTNRSVRGGGVGDAFSPYSSNNNIDESSQKSINQAITSHNKVRINTGNSQVLVQEKRDRYVQQQQDPDSSSGVSTLESSPRSSESPGGHGHTSNVPAVCPSLSLGLRNSFDPSTQSSSSSYPECDGSVTSTGTITSNKENLRNIQFRPQSFFRAPDKDFMEQTCRILAEKHRNEGAQRMSLLDFWISKIRIAAAQSRKSDICRNQENRSKIKIRMVELMELQVEQSLRYDWR